MAVAASLELKDRILQKLKENPAQRAGELALALECSRDQVLNLLYGSLKLKVWQNHSYRWFLRDLNRAPGSAGTKKSAVQFADTSLSRLCRYYLACMEREVSGGVSAFLGNPDYQELDALPDLYDDSAVHAAIRKIKSRMPKNQQGCSLYLGYPTAVFSKRSSRSQWRGLTVEPVLLFSVTQANEKEPLTIDFSFPNLNQKFYQSLFSVRKDQLLNEIATLEHKLGLNLDEGVPAIDEIAMRLQSTYTQWPWREAIDPKNIGNSQLHIDKINETGIYNRAVIIASPKSPYTLGLEKELRKLAQLSEADYKDTVLGKWLSSNKLPAQTTVQSVSVPLEVLPMNSEQRQAVTAALTRPATIITGPPGTGKSQVVTNLLINAAKSGKQALFASKNNKAVDIVETRVNNLGPRPSLLRLGAKTYQSRVAEYIVNDILGANISESVMADYEESERQYRQLLEQRNTLLKETESIIELRNNTDKLERRAESARQQLGSELFSRAANLDFDEVYSEAKRILALVDKSDRSKAAFFKRVFWFMYRKRRLAELSAVREENTSRFASIDVDLVAGQDLDSEIQLLLQAVQNTVDKQDALINARAYHLELGKLQGARPLAEIARAESQLQERIAGHSENLWKLWLRTQPSRITDDQRQDLARYIPLLRMVIDAGVKDELTNKVQKKYNELVCGISDLLPCCAVTSLSAHERIPFEAGHFDLVIFDEASQCDIASALPLLYRAKAVVVIGDPKQLSHISNLKPRHDEALLERYQLTDDFIHWSYSYQSLFALGSTQVHKDGIITLVDHHRSHADIINFSNQIFYDGQLRVATNYNYLRSPNRSEPGIRWVDVKTRAERSGPGSVKNFAEVGAVIKTMRDLIIKNNYRGSVGVVTPFRAQADAITAAVKADKELIQTLSTRGFLADTVHKFQGDERDVMIFSPVVSDGLPYGVINFLRSNGNLFNVAITRARAQLIVVGDLSACISSKVDYLVKFAGYTSSLLQHTRREVVHSLKEYGPVYPEVVNPMQVSDWERKFYTAAYKAGFRLIPQYKVEKYFADFLMVDQQRKLVIEIDGERYHRSWDGELCRRDQIRNQRLFELGYEVLRFWVYQVRDDLDGCFRRLKKWQKSQT